MAQNVPLMDAQHPSRTQLAGLAAAGSLRSIIRGNAHSRLWADPMVWTEEHLRLIDCVLISSPAPAAFRSHEPTASCYAAAVRVHASLDRLTEPCFKDRKICELLQVLMECNPNFDVRTRSRLPFYYGGKKVAKVGSALFVVQPTTSIPLFAYFDWTWMAFKRLYYFKKRGWEALTMKKRRAIANASIEPYCVAVMIAMAQAAAHISRNRGSEVTSFKVNLLMPSNNRKSLIRYCSTVPLLYLNKFDQPDRFHECQLNITKTETPIDSLEMIINTLEDMLPDNGERAGDPTSADRL